MPKEDVSSALGDVQPDALLDYAVDGESNTLPTLVPIASAVLSDLTPRAM